MDDRMAQLLRQLNQQLVALEQDNQRLKRQVIDLQVQLNRCVKIIEAFLNHT